MANRFLSLAGVAILCVGGYLGWDHFQKPDSPGRRHVPSSGEASSLSVGLDGKDPKEANREMNGRGMPVVDPQTPADMEAVAHEYTYRLKVKAKWVRERKYAPEDLQALRTARQGMQDYLKNAPASAYKDFYLRSHFNKIVEMTCFLEGKEAAVQWGAANAQVLKTLSPRDASISVQVIVNSLETVFGSFGWSMPLGNA